MPEISRFLGIVIRIYYRDHAAPHFHARYGSHSIVVDIATGTVEGRFPPRALRLLLEWYSLHRAELLEDWRRAEQRKALLPIDPLE
jgi:hypothetical protein